MRRKMRWLNLTVAAIALTFCAAMTALALRSADWGDVIPFHFGRRFGYLKSVAGLLHFQLIYVPGEKIGEFTQGRGAVTYDNYMRVESRQESWRRGFAWHRARPVDLQAYGGPGAMYTHLIVPHWYIIVPSGLIAIWFARRAWRDRQRQQRQARGQCGICGYDLRASPTCCPECGTERDGMPAAAAAAD